MANWFKKLFRAGEMMPVETDSYMDIGHFYARTPDASTPEPVSPNYIWVISNGQLLIREEKPDKETHRLNFGKEIMQNESGMNNPYGRFESSTGKLSLITPGITSFREIPQSILNKLYEAFPGIRRIYRF